MGAISLLLDTIVLLFSLVISIATPLLDAQSCLPSHLFPAPLLDLKKWYSDLYGDYLLVEKPLFFVGLVWVEILFLWPLCLANLYGILKGRSWSKTTSLMAELLSIMCDVPVILLSFSPSNEKSHQIFLGDQCNFEQVIQRYAAVPPQERYQRPEAFWVNRNNKFWAITNNIFGIQQANPFSSDPDHRIRYLQISA